MNKGNRWKMSGKRFRKNREKERKQKGKYWGGGSLLEKGGKNKGEGGKLNSGKKS